MSKLEQYKKLAQEIRALEQAQKTTLEEYKDIQELRNVLIGAIAMYGAQDALSADQQDMLALFEKIAA